MHFCHAVLVDACSSVFTYAPGSTRAAVGKLGLEYARITARVLSQFHELAQARLIDVVDSYCTARVYVQSTKLTSSQSTKFAPARRTVLIPARSTMVACANRSCPRD